MSSFSIDLFVGLGWLRVVEVERGDGGTGAAMSYVPEVPELPEPDAERR